MIKRVTLCLSCMNTVTIVLIDKVVYDCRHGDYMKMGCCQS